MSEKVGTEGKREDKVKIKVKVELFATLREKYGKSAEVECIDLKDAFIQASKIFGEEFVKEVFDENGNLRGDRIITINGRNIKDEIKKLKDGDLIAVFPPIAGG